jgi:hypothetical protein
MTPDRAANFAMRLQALARKQGSGRTCGSLLSGRRADARRRSGHNVLQSCTSRSVTFIITAPYQAAYQGACR